LLADGFAGVQGAAWALAQRHRGTPEVGRTHGMHAEPITFGLKCLGWSETLRRDRARLGAGVDGAAVGKLSGAVGTFAHLDPAVENQALWHERDISHSSVERVILPDAFLALDFMAAELREVLAGLRVDAEQMRRNLDAGGGLVHSQRVLLALTAAGMPRDEA